MRSDWRELIPAYIAANNIVILGRTKCEPGIQGLQAMCWPLDPGLNASHCPRMTVCARVGEGAGGPDSPHPGEKGTSNLCSDCEAACPLFAVSSTDRRAGGRRPLISALTAFGPQRTVGVEVGCREIRAPSI
jgi:hypothetical protein